MLRLSVHQFVSHLPLEQHASLLDTQDTFLSFLRHEFRTREHTKRALTEAAVAYGRRERVLVDALTNERQAAKAVIYAYMRLGDELLKRGKLTPPRSSFRVSKTTPAPAPKLPSRFRTVELTINGRPERIEQYPTDISWQEARAFQADPLHELPEIGLEPEIAEVGETAHFSAGSYTTGWGYLTIEGEVVERVRCWDS